MINISSIIVLLEKMVVADYISNRTIDSNIEFKDLSEIFSRNPTIH